MVLTASTTKYCQWLVCLRSALAAVPLLALLPAMAPRPAAAAAPAVGEVTLSLEAYERLLDSIVAREREQVALAASRVPDIAQVLSERLVLRIAGDQATFTKTFEVLVQGHPSQLLSLPVAGFSSTASVESLAPPRPASGAALHAGGPGFQMVPLAAGQYRVTTSGRLPLPLEGGVRRAHLGEVRAAVAEAEVELPPDSEWLCGTAVLVAEEPTSGGGSRLRLALARGTSPVIEVRRQGDRSAAESLLAQAVTVTLFQLLPEGPRRFDVVLYDVSRGGIQSHRLRLPAGVVPEQVFTDEGEVSPGLDGEVLRIDRGQRLRGAGFVMVASVPPLATAASWQVGEVQPDEPVRARYLAVASAIAAEARAIPAENWSRVDLGDLPTGLAGAIGSLDLVAAWRHSGSGTGSLAVVTPPEAVRVAVIKERASTTLLTNEGTVLLRERFTVAAGEDLLRVALPAGAELWSASVGGELVRPLEQNGELVLPLAFAAPGTDVVAEIVAVLQRAVAAGRPLLELELAQVVLPVRVHTWRLLLPENARYRFREGDLRPARETLALHPGSGLLAVVTGGSDAQLELEGIPSARDPWAVMQSTPGVLTDRINVGGNESGQQDQYVGPGREEAVTVTATAPAEAPLIDQNGAETVGDALGSSPAYYDFDKFDEKQSAKVAALRYRQDVEALKQGLVGGVKPLPIVVAESGKSLLLSGVLPPVRVGVVLEVKAARQ